MWVDLDLRLRSSERSRPKLLPPPFFPLQSNRNLEIKNAKVRRSSDSFRRPTNQSWRPSFVLNGKIKMSNHRRSFWGWPSANSIEPRVSVRHSFIFFLGGGLIFNNNQQIFDLSHFFR